MSPVRPTGPPQVSLHCREDRPKRSPVALTPGEGERCHMRPDTSRDVRPVNLHDPDTAHCVSRSESRRTRPPALQIPPTLSAGAQTCVQQGQSKILGGTIYRRSASRFLLSALSV